MFEGIYTVPEAIERYRQSWIGEEISDYLSVLLARRYQKITLQNYACMLYKFGAFVKAKGVRELAALPDWITPFIATLKFKRCFQVIWRSLLVRFISHLRQRGLIPPPEPSIPSVKPFMETVSKYIDFIDKNRGVSEYRIKSVQAHCNAFLDFVHASGIRSLSAISPKIIQRHIISQGEHYERKTMSDVCSSLRRFLSYLYLQGVIQKDFSSLVGAPRVYTHERCPRYLTRLEVRSVLASVDRQTPYGCRNYAMLLLLATYGLRGIEVVRLKLDDIDWRGEKLHILRRKAGNSTVYPLAPSVGNAIFSYIEKGRQETTHREIFLVHKAPFNPITSTSSLGHIVKKYLALAGIKVERPGTHTFRYSCAQMLFEKAVPIKNIGDYLGHICSGSTKRYTMIAVDALREVALGDGEDML